MTTIKVVGLDEISDILENVAPRHARNLMRSTVHAVATRIGKYTRESMPSNWELKKLIKARRRRSPPEQPVSQVYAEKGGFYWHFVNYGTTKQPGQGFLEDGIAKFETERDAYLYEIFTKQVEKKVRAEIKRQAKALKR